MATANQYPRFTEAVPCGAAPRSDKTARGIYVSRRVSSHSIERRLSCLTTKPPPKQLNHVGRLVHDQDADTQDMASSVVRGIRGRRIVQEPIEMPSARCAGGRSEGSGFFTEGKENSRERGQSAAYRP